MATALTVIIVILSILLVLLVLVQNSKGGGLASGFSAGNQMMGVKKTTETVEKMTWGFAGAIVFLSILAALAIPKQSSSAAEQSQVTQEVASQLPPQVDPNVLSPNANAAPAQTPAPNAQ